MNKMLHVIPGRCIGCRTCEVACAFRHANAGIPGRSRVQVRTVGKDVYVPILCLQCDEAACVKACPVFALWRNADTGAIDVQSDRCVRCNACVPAHWHCGTLCLLVNTNPGPVLVDTGPGQED